MSCEELSEELSAYLDGELSSQERAALEAHLERCPRCREELASLRAVSTLVASLPQVEPSEQFRRALNREISAHRPRRWLRPLPIFAGDLIPGLAVAALLLIAVTVAFVIPRLTSPRRETEGYRGAPQPRAEFAEPVVARDEAPAGPERVVEELSSAEVERLAVEPEAPPESGYGTAEEPLPPREPSAEPADAAGTYDFAHRGAERPAPSTESGERKEDALKGEAGTGLLAGKDDTDSLAQSSPVMSSAVRKEEEERAAVAGRAGKADERRLLADLKPAFQTVVLHCSDSGAGHAAFQKALDEFRLLSTPGADLATVRPMSDKDLNEYRRVVLNLRESPDVVLLKEIKVLASDAELIRAVFADSTELTYADPDTDVAALRRVLTSARQQPRARVSGARSSEETDRSSRLDTSLREARQAAQTQEGLGRRQEMVDVILVLKRESGPLQRAAPALEDPSGRKGL